MAASCESSMRMTAREACKTMSSLLNFIVISIYSFSCAVRCRHICTYNICIYTHVIHKLMFEMRNQGWTFFTDTTFAYFKSSDCGLSPLGNVVFALRWCPFPCFGWFPSTHKQTNKQTKRHPSHALAVEDVQFFREPQSDCVAGKAPGFVRLRRAPCSVPK